MTTLHWSLRGIGDTLARVAALEFPVSDGMTAAALAQDETFEGHLIREAEDTELGLFQPTRDEQRPLGDSMAEIEPLGTYDDAGWQIGRRRAPIRSKGLAHSAASAHPPPVGAGDAASARGNLLAAARLTEVYPLPRFQDRIVAISAQLEALEQSIHQLQTSPPKVAMGSTKTGQAIQNERLEVLALTDVRDERAAYANRLGAEIAQAKKRRKVAKSASSRQPEPVTEPSLGEETTAGESAAVQAVQTSAPGEVAPPVTKAEGPAPPPQVPSAADDSAPQEGVQPASLSAPTQPESTPELPSTPHVVPGACHHAVSRLISTAVTQEPLRTMASGQSSLKPDTFLRLTAQLLSGNDTAPIGPQTRLEAAILHDFVSSLLSGHPPQDEQSLGSEAPAGSLPYVLRPSTTFTVDSPSEDALIPLDFVKMRLADLSSANGWEEGLGQKAIYALVAKRVVRIDRKGKPLLSAC